MSEMLFQFPIQPKARKNNKLAFEYSFVHACDKRRISLRRQEEEKKSGGSLLFCLDGVGRSHIIAGDVAALSAGQGARQPPVPLSAHTKESHSLSVTHPAAPITHNPFDFKGRCSSSLLGYK